MAARLSTHIGVALLGMILFWLAYVVGFTPETVNSRAIIMFIFALIAAILMIIPIPVSIKVLFYYIGIEGFAKLMTRYNPMVHIGADILVVLLCVRVITRTLIRRESLFTNLPPLFSLFAALFAWFILTIANPYSTGFLPSLAGAKLYITMTILFFFGYYLSNSVEDVRKYMIPWLVIYLIQSVASIYQSAIGPSSVKGWSPAYSIALEKFQGYAFRPFGFASQPGGPAIYIFITMPLLIYFGVTGRAFVTRLLSLAVLPLGVVTLFLCQVRSALLKGIIGSVSYLILSLRLLGAESWVVRRRIAFAVGGAVATAALATPYMLQNMVSSYKDNERAVERTLTLFDFNSVSHAREGAMKRLIAYIKLAPLGAGLMRTGAGAGVFATDKERDPLGNEMFFSDNFWIHVQLDLGLPGLFIMTLLLSAVLLRAGYSIRFIEDPELLGLHLALFCATASVAIGCFGAEPILYNPESAFFWFFTGVLTRLPSLEEPKENESI